MNGPVDESMTNRMYIFRMMMSGVGLFFLWMENWVIAVGVILYLFSYKVVDKKK